MLTGGGARAAYQAGVLKGISEILHSAAPSIAEHPFQIISGLSAGAINGAMIASGVHEFTSTVEKLCTLWNQLKASRILDTRVGAIGRLSSGWLRDLSFGGMLGNVQSTHLLNVDPLEEFLKEQLSFERIYDNIRTGYLDGFGVSATSYATGTAITFFDGNPSIPTWTRSNRLGVREKIALEHVLASAAIPILFPPVKIGTTYYGDGSIRMASPLSPAIHMGADKIFAIGIRYYRNHQLVEELNAQANMKSITMADIAGVVLNGTFFEMLESDMERMNRINQTIQMMPAELRQNHPNGLREVPLMVIRPSEDLGALASGQFDHLPRLLRFMLSGLGASKEKGWDLLSYLAFDSAYTGKLMELGKRDARAMKPKILEFFLGD